MEISSGKFDVATLTCKLVNSLQLQFRLFTKETHYN